MEERKGNKRKERKENKRGKRYVVVAHDLTCVRYFEHACRNPIIQPRLAKVNLSEDVGGDLTKNKGCSRTNKANTRCIKKG